MRKLTILFTISIFSFFANNEVHGQFLFGPNSSLEAAAKAGRADGLYIRGINYLAQCNPDEAFKCFHQAYKDGNIRAATALGNMFEVGAGIKANTDLAWELYNYAKDRGDQAAILCINRINRDGFYEPTEANRTRLYRAFGANSNNSGGIVVNPNVGSSAGSTGNYRRVCPSCNGGRICSSCGGRGEYWIETGTFTGRDTQKLVTCPVCRGTKHCGTCRGKGYFE